MTIRTSTLTAEKGLETISLAFNGKRVRAPKGATVLEAALGADVYIPTLCYEPDLKPYGGCRLCVVEINGVRGLVSSCTTPAADGMEIYTETPKVNSARRTAIELILANHKGDCLTCVKSQECELQKVARFIGVDQAHFDRLRKTNQACEMDFSHPAFQRDPNKCILCARCVRACQEIASVGAIDIAYRGYKAKVTTFGGQPILESVCESCGECIVHCPTGALVRKNAKQATRWVKTICTYCGVGCSVNLGLRFNEIVAVEGDKESPVNRGGLCVKSRFGFDFVNHKDRLTKPLIRKEGKGKDIEVNGNYRDVFREATWEEAITHVATKLNQTKEYSRADSIGVLSSAKVTNEENYLVQKFTRAVIGTNNIDHCARLCHSSTVVGAMAAFGDGAMSNSIADFAKAELLFIIGSNTTECHPIIGRTIRQSAKQKGTRLIVADPRITEVAKLAEIHLRHKPGTDVALINAMMNVILSENLHDKDFIANRTEGFDELKKTVEKYTPEVASKITGLAKEDIEKAARLFATAEKAAILYGMGITQHTTGTDNVKSLANLLMLTGNIGKEGTGFSPLRGQNNVQGACDMGALPNMLPGYQPVTNPEARAKFEKVWKHPIDDKPGIPVTEMIGAIDAGKLKAMYIIGENPIMSEPDAGHAKRALKKLDFLVVQDIFATETAVLADVILPAATFAEKDGTFTSTERRIQKLNKAVEPPGEAMPDYQIVSMLATKMGYLFNYKNTAEIMEEVASLTPIYGGVSHERLGVNGIQWPCRDGLDQGTPTLHVNRFSRGLGKFHAIEYKSAAESVSELFPLLMTTGRVLEHWHTGTMSRRSSILESLAPGGSIDIHPDDALRLGILDGDAIAISSQRGKIETKVHLTETTAPGLAFMAFHWHEAPVNMLTNSALDPQAKIPEFKISAVKAVLAVLDRAAGDNAFFAQLANNPQMALRDYNLTLEEKAALASGDIKKIESWVGKLDERLKTWLIARLSQEKW